MDLVRLGQVLLNGRKAKDLSLREVAKNTNIAHSYISKLENAFISENGSHVQPSVKVLETLSKYYDLNLGELLELAGYEFDFDDVYTLSKQDLPQDIVDLGVEYISFAKELKGKEVPLDKVREILKILGY